MGVLDTDLLIALEAQDEDALGWIEANAQDAHTVPDVVAIEYLTGHSDAVPVLEAIERAFHIAYPDRGWLLDTARLRRKLRKRKTRIRTADFWIAAWAHHLDEHLITRNTKHFEGYGIRVETW